MTEVKDMGLSVAQAAAVTDERPQVLVAAAAGSGKTRLLVASVVRALAQERLPVERLVAVTFTRKAGEELASRVREALEGCGRPDLARSLDSAVLGTIDSLCRRLVKDQALAVGVDPACGVLEADAAELVKREVADKAWQAVVERADEAALEILASQGKTLCDDAVAVYDRLRGLGQEAPQIPMPAGSPEPEAREQLTVAIGLGLEAGLAHPKPSATLAADLTKLRDCLDWLQRPAGERAGDAGMRASSGFFPSRRTRALEEEFEQVRSALIEYRCALAQDLLTPVVGVTNKLLAEFDVGYAARKAEHGLLDFADLELKARELLTKGAPLQGCFLLVDEFQDTNELQCAILSGLGADRVLMVGDERQSIYRFRGADVDVFKKRRTALASAGQGAQTGGLHHLDVNYRSAPEILDFINALFSHETLFGRDFARLAADPERVSVCPAQRPGAAGPQVARAEVVVAERRREGEGDGRLVSMQQAEAEAIAAHVRGMLDQEGWRQRDIVLLLPTQTQVERYRDALQAAKVDVFVVRGKGYYSQEEVTDVVSLLRLLLNPHDDLALVTVLRSPLAGVSDDTLYLLGVERRKRRARSLWEVLRGGQLEALSEADRDVLAQFGERMGQMRTRVGRPGLARLIDDAVSAFSYDLCLLAAPEGRRRFANVRKLMRLAEEFEKATGPDLGAFLSAVKSTGQVSDREGSAPTLGEADDVVRVMTVHQAKGLEFPVVVVAGLGADAHRTDMSTFAVGRDGQVGLFLKGYRHPTYESLDPCCGPAAEIANDEKRREQEEDLRVLYVAMTRAQERLVLVGARPTKDSMEGTRIGRIVTALGLSQFPESGQVVPVADLAATVTGAAPAAGAAAPDPATRAPADEPAPGGQRAASDETDTPEAGPPTFLDLPPKNGVPSRVSFSSLAAYKRCPRQYYLERVLGLSLSQSGPGQGDGGAEVHGESVLDADEEHAGRDVGILVHSLLERLGTTAERPTVGQVREAAEAALPSLGVVLSTQDLDRAVGLTLAVWDSPVAGRLSLPSALREAPFLFAAGGTLVSGVMDLLCREPDCWSVTDYKTNALRGRPTAEAAESYGLQCVVYGLAALRAGAPAVQMDLLFLEDPSQLVSVRYTTDDLSRLERELIEAFSGMKEARFPAVVGQECERCSVVSVCSNMVAA